MDEETKTIITIESYTRTVIRRSRYTVEVTPEPVLLQPQLPAIRSSSSRLVAATKDLCQRLRGRVKPAQKR